MTEKRDQYELLLQYLNGALSDEDMLRVERMLQHDSNAVHILAEIAEQAMMLADLAQLKGSTSKAHQSQTPSANQQKLSFEHRRRSLVHITHAAIALITTAVVAAVVWLTVSGQPEVSQQVEVIELTGVTNYYNNASPSENRLKLGSRLQSGDIIESRSCDAWISLQVAKETALTIAGHSAIRVVASNHAELHIELQQGSIWFSPFPHRTPRQIKVTTPTMEVYFRHSMLNIQTSPSESIVRVDQGEAEAQRLNGKNRIKILPGYQCYVSKKDQEPPLSIQQPIPINHWSSIQMKGTEVLLGTWLPATEQEPVRLGASPLLWPLPESENVTLYAAAIAAWRCSERPVLLHADSKIRFRGRTQKPHTVRLGFSAQKMYGVFAGKFEIDIPASSINSNQDYWTIELPLSDFHPLHPHLAASPEGLELTDVYALTIAQDAGLEITEIELVSPNNKP